MSIRSLAKTPSLTDVARARDAGNVDDHPAATAFHHVYCRFSTAEKDVHQIDGTAFVEVSHGHFRLNLAALYLHQQSVTRDAGIVDHAIDTAKVFYKRR